MLKFYYNSSPNPTKVALLLEEAGLPYEAVPVDTRKGDQHRPEFLAINPNGKVPVIVDDGVTVFDSNAILLYLAEKTGQLLTADPARRLETIQWLFWQMSFIGPMFGQVGFFNKWAGRHYEDKRPLQRYVGESKRLLGVLDRRLDGRGWVMGDYSIADIALLGWVRNLITLYEARELVGFDGFANVGAWLERGLARPAVQRGLEIPAS
jgi:GSH-dependent disulfide-bond oxidoreductase